MKINDDLITLLYVAFCFFVLDICSLFPTTQMYSGTNFQTFYENMTQ